jgi:hypothetical protein
MKFRISGFIKTAIVVAVIAAAIGVEVPLLTWAAENDLIKGIDAMKLEAIKLEDLQKVTFVSLATHPYIEANNSCNDDDKRKWAQVMSAVFPESLDQLQGMGWVKHDESKRNYVFASEAPKLRLTTVHLFAVIRGEVSASRNWAGLYCKFIGNAPFEEAYLTGKSPYELLESFFNNGGEDLSLLIGGEKSLDAYARAWEKDNGIKLRGGSTLEGVSIMLSIQVPELYSYGLGGVKIALQRRDFQPRQIVLHGKGVVDAAMMMGAVRAKYKALDEDNGQWQNGFCQNLKADLKTNAILSGRLDALEVISGRKAVPDQAFAEALLDAVSESLTAKAYPEDMKFINRSDYGSLFLDSSLLDPSEAVQYPGYQKLPRTKTTAAVNAVRAVKGAIVSRAMGDADMETRYRKLAESFLHESEVTPEMLAVVEEVFQSIFSTFNGRRTEFLEALKRRQDAAETDEIANVRINRESYLLNMAPLRKTVFVDAAYDGLMELKKALQGR